MTEVQTIIDQWQVYICTSDDTGLISICCRLCTNRLPRGGCIASRCLIPGFSVNARCSRGGYGTPCPPCPYFTREVRR